MTTDSYERLYTAINTNRLIAFIGSGLSLVYGNLTWDEFISTVVKRFERDLDLATPLAPNDVLRLRAQLSAIVEEEGYEDGVIVLELVRQGYRLVDDATGRAPQKSFQDALKAIFESDRSFVLSTLKTRLERAKVDPMSVAGAPATARPAEGDPDDALYAMVSSIYSVDFLTQLAPLGEPGAPGLGDLARKLEQEQPRQAGRGGRLPIDRRSVLCIYLAAAVLNRKPVKPKLDGLKIQPAAPPRPLLDPLRELHRDLGIRRFFTINYDLELENLLMFDDIRELAPDLSLDERLAVLDRGADSEPLLSGATLFRNRADGIAVRSDVNDGKHTAPLVEFAIGSARRVIHIFHHHGRVDQPQTMVAADGEYNRMYRGDGLHRHSLDLAYDLMMNGNPIMFVGTGLSEQELTRTLRQKVSNVRSPQNVPVFMLRAATGEPRELIREQLRDWTKFGVHVIHYGHPRRGARYALRQHLQLLDSIAANFGFKGDEKIWKEPLVDPSGPALSASPDMDHALARLIGDYRLIHDLDFDRYVVAWLLSRGGFEFAKRVRTRLHPPRGRPPAGRNSPARRAAALLSDYLKMLASKLETAALRHELRQMGREAKLFFDVKSRRLEPREVAAAAPDMAFVHEPAVRAIGGAGPARRTPDPGREGGPAVAAVVPRPSGGLWIRHLSVAHGTGGGFRWNHRLWDWIPLHTDRNAGGGAYDGEPPNNHYYPDLIQRLGDAAGQGPKDWLREIVIGERGVGKGGFLKKLVLDLQEAGRKDLLLVNCCYGQEVDSAVTLIRNFLCGEPDDRYPRTRRQQIMAYRANGRRPLLVLGAIDRLFGTDNQPLGAEFDWLLGLLHAPDTQLDLIITSSLRSEAYFKELSKARQALPVSAPPLSMVRVQTAGGSPDPSLPGEVRSGFLALLNKNAMDREGQSTQQDSSNARIRMAHGARRVELIVGGEIDALGFASSRRLGLREVPLRGIAQEILKTLSFIGLPIEAEVLLSAPGVRREIARLVCPRNGKTSRLPSANDLLLRFPGARDCFLDSLDLALKRHLVTVVEPHAALQPQGAEKPGKKTKSGARHAIGHRRRFVLHRLVSQVMRERFGVPISETMLSDSFNLSLYTAQPDDAPASDPTVTTELEELLEHLMHSVRDVALESGLETALKRLKKPLLKKTVYVGDPLAPEFLARLYSYEHYLRLLDPAVPCALRAAGGVIRGFFLSVNLLGLDLGDTRKKAGVGVITAHGDRIRRLIEAAFESERLRRACLDDSDEHFQRFWNEMFSLEALVTDPDEKPARAKECRQPLMPEVLNLFGSADNGAVSADIAAKRLEVAALGPTRPEQPRGSLLSRGKPVLLPLWKTLLDVKPKIGDARALQDPHALNLRPYYSEEIVWLLNERAMLSLAQGDLYSASTTFELALEANREIEGTRYHPNRCRLLLNRSFLWIERGKIAEARRCLMELSDGIGATDDALSPTTTEGRLIRALATGYLGLCDQLNGLATRAAGAYRAALAELGDLREQRAIAIFELHLGSLLKPSCQGEPDLADACLVRAIAAAEGGRHTDILYRIRVTKAYNDHMRKRIGAAEALSVLRTAVDYGEQLDMHRVAVEALSASTMLRLELGDIEAAARDCERALALATQYGMTLRRAWLRVTMGQVYEVRGDSPNARFMYEHAIEAAERMGYQRPIEAASARLMAMGRD